MMINPTNKLSQQHYYNSVSNIAPVQQNQTFKGPAGDIATISFRAFEAFNRESEPNSIQQADNNFLDKGKS